MKLFIAFFVNLIVVLLFIFPFTSFADGFIIIEPPYPWPPRPVPQPPQPMIATPFPLEVKIHHVSVKIENQVAVTDIDQVFYNPTENRLQGYYLFPVPKGSVLNKFSMFIDGKEVTAELLDADKARQIYEDYVRKMIDPALLEYTEQGLLKVRIFPINPHSEKRVKLSYQEILNKDNNTVEYTYPLNTEKFSASPLEEVSVKVKISSPERIKNVYCPTHDVDIVRNDNHSVTVSYEANNVKPNMDFRLFYAIEKSSIGMSLLTYGKGKEDGFFFLSLSPGFAAEEQEIAEKDIIFVLDVSGSMAGDKLAQAKKALLFCIENLNAGDRFEVIRFSTRANALFNSLSPVNQSNRDKAEKFVENLKAIGGTNIEEALQLALGNKSKTNRPHFVVFITDGKPTIGEMDENALLKKIHEANRGNLRIFTFGVGYEINTHLLDKITENTHAYRTYITPDEDIEVEISNFYSKVSSPVLTDLTLTVEEPVQISEVYPQKLPDIFKGASVTVLGRYRGNGVVRITLEGMVNDTRQSFSYTAGFGDRDETYEFIPSLWASRAVGFMLDQIRLFGENEELKKEIIEFARTYGIITPYTSYLIIEDEAKRVSRHDLQPQYQLLRQNVVNDQEFMLSTENEYAEMNVKSGRAGVYSSETVQSMSGATSLEAGRQTDQRLSYRNAEGEKQNLVKQNLFVQGRAFYQAGDFWIDSYIQQNNDADVVRIQIASKGYFDLLNNEKGTAKFLALGRNVRFFWKGQIYEIYE
jgi:Ca-activated chloride channel family protein